MIVTSSNLEVLDVKLTVLGVQPSPSVAWSHLWTVRLGLLNGRSRTSYPWQKMSDRWVRIVLKTSGSTMDPCWLARSLRYCADSDKPVSCVCAQRKSDNTRRGEAYRKNLSPRVAPAEDCTGQA